MNILYSVTESDLALEYAQVVCPQCRDLSCMRAENERDDSVYYDLPERSKAAMRRSVKRTILRITVPEAAYDVLMAVVERQLG